MPRGFDKKKIDEDHKMWTAFLAGFTITSEGWNGEYPELTPMEGIRKAYEKWRAEVGN